MHPLREPSIVAQIENHLRLHLDPRFRVVEFNSRDEAASHPAALLKSDHTSVFVKLTRRADGLEQFDAERFGLDLLRTQANVLVPQVYGALACEGGTLLIQSAVDAVERGPSQWRAIGEALAQVHDAPAALRSGLHRDTFWGDLRLDNLPHRDWREFYLRQRLLPHLQLAIDSGHLDEELRRDVENVVARYDSLCGDAQPAHLLHGDAHGNNYISTLAGAVLIDPSVHYGSVEYDLAMLDLFQPIPNEVFEGYWARRVIDPGFAERRQLWRIGMWLAIVSLDGAKWCEPLRKSVEFYL